MTSKKEIEEYLDILDDIDNSNNSNYFNLLIAYKKMLKNKKSPEYSLLEYEYLFKEFYKEYKNKIYKERKNIKEIIGGYGELLFYKKLSKNSELDITWVSRNHGDKYGFDFVTYDEISKEYTFYEIKTTINPNKLGEFYLTPNEYKKYIKLSDISITNEKIKFILANILIDDKDIIDEVDYYINDIIELIEINKSVISKHNNKISSHEDNILTKKLIDK